MLNNLTFITKLTYHISVTGEIQTALDQTNKILKVVLADDIEVVFCDLAVHFVPRKTKKGY